MQISKDILIRAREISNNLVQGINPLDDRPIENADFLSDPKMIRYFSFISDVLTDNIENFSRLKSSRRVTFSIAPEKVKDIILPPEDINISTFVDAVNSVADLEKHKKLTAMQINSQLKAMGILRTEKDEENKNRTRVTPKGFELGIIEEEVERTDRNYFRIIYTQKGKRFLLENLIDILNFSA